MRKALDGGSDSGRLNIICLAEGFTQGERSTFEELVDQLVAAIKTSRWYEHGMVNVHSIAISSRESAQGLKPHEGPNDTAFGAEYGGEWSGGDRRPHVITGEYQRARDAVDVYFTQPHKKHIIVIVNSDRHGGSSGVNGTLCWSYSDIENPRRWTGVALHEWGHLMGLADEYGGAADYPGEFTIEPSEPNVTLDPTGAKWKHIAGGVVPGGKGYNRGIYHQNPVCRMNQSTQPFCRVCRHHIVERLSSGTETAAKPVASAIVVTHRGETQEFVGDVSGVIASQRWLLSRLFG